MKGAVPGGGGGHSNMKVTYLCLPKYDTRGLSVAIFVQKRGSFSGESKKIGVILCGNA